MSALARYCMQQNIPIAGYDKTPHLQSKKLEADGVQLVYDAHRESIPKNFTQKNTLVVYTPAVPKTHDQLLFFQDQGNRVIKRAQFLAELSNSYTSFAIAGTHGKTTTSSMLAHVLQFCKQEPWAFLGGIANNFKSNFVAGNSDKMVLEADEFDRSFLYLKPSFCLIANTEADHLDIYGSAEQLMSSFNDLAQITKENRGKLICHDKVQLNADFTYGKNGDYQLVSKKYENGYQHLTIKNPQGESAIARLSLPGDHNAENALGAAALAHLSGCDWQEVSASFESFLGVYRRFDVHINTGSHAYVDDYAHHPTEIKAAIQGFKELRPNDQLLLVFQPHLFSRTRDFMSEFAEALSMADALFLLDIYPAREEPIEGISSSALLELCSLRDKKLLSKQNLLEEIENKSKNFSVMTLGAGDIDALVPEISESLKASWDEK